MTLRHLFIGLGVLATAVASAGAASACRMPLPERVPAMITRAQADALESYGQIYQAEVVAVGQVSMGAATFTVRPLAAIKGEAPTENRTLTFRRDRADSLQCSILSWRTGDDIHEGGAIGNRFVIYEGREGSGDDPWSQKQEMILHDETLRFLEPMSAAPRPNSLS